MRSYISLSLDPTTAKLLQERGQRIKNLSKFVCTLIQENLADKDFERKQAFATFNSVQKDLEKYGYTAILQEKAQRNIK